MNAKKRIMILTAALVVCFSGANFSGLAYKMEKYMAGRKIMTAIKGYKILEKEGAKIFFTAQDEDYAHMMSRTTALFFPALKRDFKLEEDDSPVIVIYPDEAGLRKAVGHKEKKTPTGVYCGGIINILSPRLWAGEVEADITDRFLKEGPLVHELTHYLFDLKTKGNFDLWFAEGVALFYEYKYTGAEWRADLKNSAGNITLREMSLDFKSLEQTVAYRYSFELVNNMVRQKGENYLQQVISGMGVGKSFDGAVAGAK